MQMKEYKVVGTSICICICIFYIIGVDRFADDIQDMMGFKPGIYWITCWKYIAPLFILVTILHVLLIIYSIIT